MTEQTRANPFICGFDDFVANNGLESHPAAQSCIGNFYGLTPRSQELEETMKRMKSDTLWRHIGYAASLYTQAHAEHQAWEESCIDPMTGLYNRKGLAFHMRQRMKQILRFNQENAEPISGGELEPRRLVGFYIDVDRFKDVNDTLGHIEGDRILQHIGKQVRASDIIGVRMSGDEFVILALAKTKTDEGVGRRGEEPKSIEERLEEFEQALISRLQPVFKEAGIRGLSLSIGHTIWDGEQTPAEFLKAMDDAMFTQKKVNRHKLYKTNSIWQRGLARLSMIAAGLAGNAAKDMRLPR